MSLFKQLFIAIFTLMLMFFIGSFLISVESSREQQESQLHSHAQDAATALGLSLSTHIDDPAMMELMVNSIFDSGYFYSIKVIDLETEQPLIERSGAPVKNTAPGWFAELIDLRPALAEAEISDGWRRAGRVEVISHPVFAIGKLWAGTLASLLWLAVLGLAALILGAAFLKKQLRPLDYLVKQSNAIVKREFITIEKLPKTTEFKRVVSAMNQMVEKLKALFAEEAARSEKLHAEAYLDNLTGLANRRHFGQQLESRLNDQEQATSGHLLLIQLMDLATLNQTLGGQRTDHLIADVGSRLSSVIDSQMLLARTRGGEFALLAPGLQKNEAEQTAEQLLQIMSQVSATLPENCRLTTNIGITSFEPKEEVSALYRRLDQALTTAMSKGENNFAFSGSSQHGHVFEEQRRHWYELLDHALEQEKFQLFFQPVVYTENQKLWHYKILARLPDNDGNLLPAGAMLPWLERFGWMTRLDLGMLKQTFAHLQKHPLPVAVSLSGQFLKDDIALAKLYKLLKRNKNLARLLTFELDEDQLPAKQQLEAVAAQLQKIGFGLALQHFGGRFSMIGNLSRLGLQYLKIDGGYIRDIDQEKDKQLFIEAMQRAAISIDLPLIAERVETDGEYQTLTKLCIAGAQGQLFGEPTAWQE